MVKFKSRILIFLARNLIFLFIKFLKLTCDIKFKGEIPNFPCVVVFWHSRLALMILSYEHYYKNYKKTIKVMISSHKDGKIISDVIAKFGVGTIVGSTFRGKISALKNSIDLINGGDDLGITPDGPRGPVNSISDGAILIAKNTNTKICVVNYEASAFWQLNSWDKMIIPKPFSKVNFSVSPPIEVSNIDIIDAKELIKDALMKAKVDDSVF